jgi:hypothetical protein
MPTIYSGEGKVSSISSSDRTVYPHLMNEIGPFSYTMHKK